MRLFECILISSLFLISLLCAIQMELSMHTCDKCHKIKKLNCYGYAGMFYCKICAKKEGYK